jgi:type VII secretion-associated protein (TIGR03931 family)
MTGCVVEVGPGAVRGPRQVDSDLVSTALECIDDEIALLDEQPVAVTALWRAVFRSAMPDGIGTATLICPSWWPSSRVDRVEEAAACVAADVVVLHRSRVLADDVPGMPTVVEIAPDFVVAVQADRLLSAEPRIGEAADVARAVADGIAGATAVLIDAPVGVDSAAALAGAISTCLRVDGVAVTLVHQDRLLAEPRELAIAWERVVESRGRKGPKAAVLTAIVVSIALLCAGFGPWLDMDGSRATPVPMRLLVEGRLSVMVPAQWSVRRIMAGPGSARVQVTPPDGGNAVLITQSQVRKGESLAATAASLRTALDGQQAGIFSRFNPDDRWAGRPAATYREVRDGRQVDWAVFVDHSVRIAIGCQSAPGTEAAVRHICDEAVRSARSII